MQSKNIELEAGKSFREYITDYMSNEQEQAVDKLVGMIDVDKSLFTKMLSQGLTEKNINDFGHFDELKSSVNRTKAKTFFEQHLGKKMNILQVNREIDKMLRGFILSGYIKL